MNKFQIRAFIKFKYLEKKKPKVIHAELQEQLQASAPSLTTIRFWINEFKRGRRDIKDEARPGRPKTSIDDIMVQNGNDLMKQDG